MKNQTNIIAPIVTGVCISSIAVFLHDQHKKGTLKAYLEEWKNNVLQQHYEKYAPQANLEKSYPEFPSDKTYIMLKRTNRSN